MNSKVLMLGGHLCGKTSALASMFDEVINGPFNKYITVVDHTLYTECMEQTLNTKRLENLLYIKKRPQSLFAMESGAGFSICEYKLKAIPAGCNKEVNIDFIDIPGSMIKNGYHFFPQIRSLTQECSSILVFVDTPFLMECNAQISDSVNVVHEISEILTSIECNTIESSKLVLFVPVKCEKWIHEGRAGEVIAKIKQSYRNIINCLTSNKCISVGILLIQSIGSIEFVEMLDSNIILGEGLQIKYGSKLFDNLYRMPDGRMARLKPGEEMCPDETRLLECGMYKPIAWFKAESDTNKYITHRNCNRIFFHILKFYADKLASQPKGFRCFFPPYGNGMKKELSNMLNELEKDGYFVRNKDGIEYIKQFIK